MRLVHFQKVNEKCHDKVTFIRVEPIDLKITLQNIIEALSDVSWIAKFDKEYIRESFRARAMPTIDDITQKLSTSSPDKVSSDAGEYVVSELSRTAIKEKMRYNCIPLAELFSRQKSGNPGFDFHIENDCKTLLFGEAKYVAAQNAYGTALSQIVNFISDSKDVKDIADLEGFFCEQTLQNASNGQKGFAAGFAARNTSDADLISNIQKNRNYKKLLKYHELVLVAVNL